MTETPAIIPVINLTSGLAVTVKSLDTGENGNGMLRPEARVSVMLRGKPEAVEFLIGDYDGVCSFPLDHRSQHHGCEEFLKPLLNVEENVEAVEEFDEAMHEVLTEASRIMDAAATAALLTSQATAQVARTVLDLIADGDLRA